MVEISGKNLADLLQAGAGGLGTLAILVGGFAMMLGQKRWCGWALLSAISLLVIAATGRPVLMYASERLIKSSQSQGGFVNNWLLFLLCAASVVSAIFRAGRAALGFASWPLTYWFVLPMVEATQPMLSPMIHATIYVIVSLLSLQAVLIVLFGRAVADRAIGHFVVDAVGGIVQKPIRAFRESVRRFHD